MYICMYVAYIHIVCSIFLRITSCEYIQPLCIYFVLSQAEAEEALAAALPALEEARIALSDLEKSDVTEIRSMQCDNYAVSYTS